MMIRKYLPFVALIGAACLLWWVKTNQRGNYKPSVKTEHIKIQPSPGNDSPGQHNDPSVSPVRNDGFNRRVAHIIYSKHARCRMDCRHIDESEVKEILEKGQVNYNKVENDARGKTYPVEGITHDKQHVRIVFAPKDDGDVVVVTVIDLDTEWQCDCK